MAFRLPLSRLAGCGRLDTAPRRPREIVRRGGRPVWRESLVTDNGNSILDVHDWRIADPVGMERDLNQIPGVVTVGLFAQRPADIVLIGESEMG